MPVVVADLTKETFLLTYFKTRDRCIAVVAAFVLCVQLFILSDRRVINNNNWSNIFGYLLWVYSAYIQHIIIHESFHNQIFFSDPCLDRLASIFFAITIGIPFVENLRLLHTWHHYYRNTEKDPYAIGVSAILDSVYPRYLTFYIRIQYVLQAFFIFLCLYHLGVAQCFVFLLLNFIGLLLSDAYHFFQEKGNKCVPTLSILCATYHYVHPQIPITKIGTFAFMSSSHSSSSSYAHPSS